MPADAGPGAGKAGVVLLRPPVDSFRVRLPAAPDRDYQEELMSDGTRRRMKLAAQKALRTWGREAQILKAAEEAIELANALMHYKGDGTDDGHYARLGDVIDEIADCEIMLAQLRLMFNIGGQVDQRVLTKLERLEGLLDAAEAKAEPATEGADAD